MTGLPFDFFPRARKIILPLVETEDEREALLTDAFYLLPDSRLYYQIKRDGSPMNFTTLLLKDLSDYGCVTNTTHALGQLFSVARMYCGVDKHAEIDDLVAVTNDICVSTTSSTSSTHSTTVVIDTTTTPAPIQTLETPRDERRPTVFISYSHVDMAFADQLIADLQKVGHPCWIDKSKIKGGDEWIMTISEGIINSYAFVPILSRKAMDSSWVRKEILWAVDKKKLVLPVILEDVFDHPFFFLLKDVQGFTVFDSSYTVVLPQLLDILPSPSLPVIDIEEIEEEEEAAEVDDRLDMDKFADEAPAAPAEREMAAMPGAVAPSRSQSQTVRSVPRKLELAYMERLKLEELLNTEKYTALGGISQQAQKPEAGKAEMRAVFELLPMNRDAERRTETKRFEDAVSEIQRLQRAVLLGEPGGGKTTTLWKLADELVQKAMKERNAPIPILIRLGKWTDADQPLHDFVASQMGDLGQYLSVLLQEKRAALLLDGLNEIPVSQRMGRDTLKNKTEQVQQFVEANADLLAVVSCRELDYTIDLGFDRINITPLDPIRIREFVQHYLNTEKEPHKGDELFWKLAGTSARSYYNRIMTDLVTNGVDLEQLEKIFWLETTVPVAHQPMNHEGKKRNPYGWDNWLKVREHPSSLMVLARNPYMLLMLTSVYADEGELPANRGQLFAKFVEKLLEREAVPEAEQPALLERLGELAYEMQVQRAQITDEGDALTVLPEDEVKRLVGKRLLYLAGSASILSIGEQVRFTHQLLQEYFAATAMDERIKSGRLQARDIWRPERWWERTNWEEAVILLAGLYSDDPTTVVEWLKDANPEVAADCITRSGSVVPPDETLLKLRESWIPRLTDLKNNPMPEGRAAVGRALGRLKLSDGTPLDNRKGVAFIIKDGLKLPDIDWVEIHRGEFIYQDNEKLFLPTFQISRYPVTMVQFQTFLIDPQGFTDPIWFEGLAAEEREHSLQDQTFRFSNHPRETVSWYHVMAFCRWYSWRMGGRYALDKIDEWAVRLPTEFEWERATRGTNGNEYPWGDGYKKGYANIDETGGFMGEDYSVGEHNIKRTSAVGIYPQGKSQEGVLDMSGNVWEWCLTDYRNPQQLTRDDDLSTLASRVLRGGSWSLNNISARAAYRRYRIPGSHDSSHGFRLCRPHNDS